MNASDKAKFDALSNQLETIATEMCKICPSAATRAVGCLNVKTMTPIGIAFNITSDKPADDPAVFKDMAEASTKDCIRLAGEPVAQLLGMTTIAKMHSDHDKNKESPERKFEGKFDA